MKQPLTLILIAILLLGTRCSKDNFSKGARLSKIYANGQLQVEYAYTASGLLQSYSIYSDPSRQIFVANYHYNDESKLVKAEIAMDFSSGPTPQWSNHYTDYTYTADGKVGEERAYQQQGGSYTMTSKTRSDYDAGGRLVSRKMYLPNDTLVLTNNYAYNGAGNIVLNEQYRNTSGASAIEYRYRYDNFDNKMNPNLGLASAVPPFSINPNNILQTTVTNYVNTPGTPITSVTNTVYNDYNGRGLPTKFSENGVTYTLEYQ